MKVNGESSHMQVIFYVAITSHRYKKRKFSAHTFALESSMSTSKFEVSDGLLTSGMYGATAETTTTQQ